MHLTFYLMVHIGMNMSVQLMVLLMAHLKKDTSTFEVEIKGAVEVTIELHLKMYMVMRLLVQKSAQNYSLKDELDKALYVALKEHLWFHFKETQRFAKKMAIKKLIWHCSWWSPRRCYQGCTFESQIWFFMHPLHLI